MASLDNLSRSDLGDIFRRLRALETATPLQNASIGAGGIRVYGGGGITIEDGGLSSGDTTVTGTLTTNGPLDVNGATTLDGTTTARGAFTTEGALSIDGPATLDNDLTVAAGRRITAGGLSLENTGAAAAQVNVPGGSIAATATAMIIDHATIEIAGATVKLSSLPTTTQPANLYADPATGKLYRSTA